MTPPRRIDALRLLLCFGSFPNRPPPHPLRRRHTGGELMDVSIKQTSHGAADVIGSERVAPAGAESRSRAAAAVATQVFCLFHGSCAHPYAHVHAEHLGLKHQALWSSWCEETEWKYLRETNPSRMEVRSTLEVTGFSLYFFIWKWSQSSVYIQQMMQSIVSSLKRSLHMIHFLINTRRWRE